MLVAEAPDRRRVERVAQAWAATTARVRGPIAAAIASSVGLNVSELDVHVDRHQAELVERRDRRREPDRGRDHLVAGAQRALVQVRAGRRHRQQVRLRAGAHERDMAALGDLGQAGAEAIGPAALGQPAVERGVGERGELGSADDLAGDRHHGLPRHELLGLLEGRAGIALDGGERFGTQGAEVAGLRPVPAAEGCWGMAA